MDIETQIYDAEGLLDDWREGLGSAVGSCKGVDLVSDLPGVDGECGGKCRQW